MLASSIPTKFAIPFGASAGGGYIRPIPQASQTGITPGAASLTDGFPPLCFLPVGSGGIPPFGQDFNGILNEITQWSQWQGAGGLPVYDATFSTAIGGYPAGALLSATSSGGLWLNLVDNNTVNPDTVGTNWMKLSGSQATWAGTFAGSANALTASLTPAIASYVAGQSVRGLALATNTGAATLNVNGVGVKSIVRPGGAPLLPGDLLAGAICEFTYDGTNFELINLSGRAGTVFSCGQFQCTSTTVCTLVPFKGNVVTFPSGAVAQIPSGGIASTVSSAYLNGTASSALSANVLYYAYLWNQGSTTSPNWVIDWSTTGHATDIVTGIEIKSGDATRVLVGMAYTGAGPTFLDNASSRLVATWNNRRPRQMASAFTANRSTSSSSFVEVNTEIRTNFVSWGDAVAGGFYGSAGTGGTSNIGSGVSIDGSTSLGSFFQSLMTPSGGGFQVPSAASGSFSPSEGFHYLTMMGLCGGGTATWQYNGASTGSSQLSGSLVS